MALFGYVGAFVMAVNSGGGNVALFVLFCFCCYGVGGGCVCGAVSMWVSRGRRGGGGELLTGG